MSEQQHQQDPSANTAQFQAFVSRDEPEPARRSSLPLIIGIVAVVVLLGALVTFLIAS